MSQQYIHKCRRLIAAAIRLRNSINPLNSVKSQISNYPDTLKSIDIPFEFLTHHDGKIGMRSIIKHPLLRISMFHIPTGAVMKLHDHPQMQVISFILQGSMQATLFTSIPGCDYFSKKQEYLTKGKYHFTEPIQNNYHEFSATKECCTFLDILFPDYDDDERPCTYYDYEKVEGNERKNCYRLIALEKDYHKDMCQI